MSKAKISKDVKSTAKISELKVKRNLGELTPEVVQMCCDQLDEMAKVAVEYAKTKKKDLSSMINELRNNPAMLAEVCKFSDAYEEILYWNHLIDSKKIPMGVTVSHREIDIAMFNEICETYRATYTADIAYMLYNYAHSMFDTKMASK